MKTGFTAIIYTDARCEEDCRFDIWHLDEIWETPETVVDRINDSKETVVKQFDRFECSKYYDRLVDEPEECDDCFRKMIETLQKRVSRWKRPDNTPGFSGTWADHIEERFQDVHVVIKQVVVML